MQLVNLLAAIISLATPTILAVSLRRFFTPKNKDE